MPREAPRGGSDDPRFAGLLWHRLRWADCWGSARGWPSGDHTAFTNVYVELDALDIPPAERTRRLVDWLEEHGDPAAVERDVAAATDTVRRFDVRAPAAPFRRLRAVPSRRSSG